MPTSPKKPTGRRNVPLYVMLPPDELARVKAFAAKVGRPLSWAVRDALTVYLDALEADADRMAVIKLDLSKAGRTVPLPTGRPRKVKETANVR